MAIAKMLKMRLVAITQEQNKLLDSLHKTGAVEIKESGEMQDFGKKEACDKSLLEKKRENLRSAMQTLDQELASVKKNSPAAQAQVDDGFGVTYDEFKGIASKEKHLTEVVNTINGCVDRLSKLKAERVALQNEVKLYNPYINVDSPFSAYVNTKCTCMRLGIVSDRNYEKLVGLCDENELIYLNVESIQSSCVVVAVVCHIDELKRMEEILGECSFSKCAFKEDVTALQKIEGLNALLEQNGNENASQHAKILSCVSELKDLKILDDYYNFCAEKAQYSENFYRSNHTFFLEAFVPEESKDAVEKAVLEVTKDIYYQFDEIQKDEFAPTLMKNKKISKNFEFVTNMYSVPKYGSFDPNAIMSVFFSIFLGFITADWGYGLLMSVGGYIFAKMQKRDVGVRRLAVIIATSGIASIIFGLMFDSLFGIPLLRNLKLIESPIMPDPVISSDIAGISVPTLLLISLGMGTFQIMVGNFLQGIISMQRGNFWDGLFDGFVWATFLLGLIVLVLEMAGVTQGLMTAAIVTIIVSVGIGALTAGRHAKGFGKITKSFASVYGLINYMSDILSYARIYGLMLSGAQIASIVSINLAIPMMQGGGVGIVFGIIVFIIGHVFNIAMGTLGAYIHDARLQYVEFFSRFYEGDGELFTPIGSKFSHLYITD